MTNYSNQWKFRIRGLMKFLRFFHLLGVENCVLIIISEYHRISNERYINVA